MISLDSEVSNLLNISIINTHHSTELFVYLDSTDSRFQLLV